MGMTRKEAIKQLRLLKGDITFGIASKVENKNQIEALSIAIASLETDEAYDLEYEQPKFCKDCISREAVYYYISSHINEIITESGTDKNAHTNAILRSLANGVKLMPSVLPDVTDNNVGNIDCISREQAKAAIRVKFKDLPSRVEINTILNDLPTVTPISKECTDCIAEDKTFMKMDRIKQLLNSDKFDDLEVLNKIREVVEDGND